LFFLMRMVALAFCFCFVFFFFFFLSRVFFFFFFLWESSHYFSPLALLSIQVLLERNDNTASSITGIGE